MIKFSKSNFEKITFFILGASFFIGIWHGFPMLNIVNDEMYFVGGVLRAIENWSILPLGNDVPYGTITYLLNYFLIAGFLLVLFPFFNFDISSLKTYLIESPEVIYYIPRFLSAILGLFFLYIILDILRREIADQKHRICLALLLFTNMITVIILHTGKMWVLSTLLVLVSFYFLYRSLSEDIDVVIEKRSRNIFLSVIFSFLAWANFPLNIFSLVNIPISYFYFRKESAVVQSLIKAIFLGAFLFVLISLMNFEGIKGQIISIFTDYHPIMEETGDNLSFLASLILHSRQALMLFPLLLIWATASIFGVVKNKRLIILSAIYGLTYFVFISGVATWVSEYNSYLRYLYPLGIFLLLFSVGFEMRFPKILYLVSALSTIYFIFLLYYIAIPTTNNLAYDWAMGNINNNSVIISENVHELQLPKNRDSYILNFERYCATKCRNVLDRNLNQGVKFLVVDQESDIKKMQELNYSEIFLFEPYPVEKSDLELVMVFENGMSGNSAYSIDSGLGNYLNLEFFKIKNLGSDIYIYKRHGNF